jgi:hypothetical protein
LWSVACPLFRFFPIEIFTRTSCSTAVESEFRADHGFGLRIKQSPAGHYESSVCISAPDINIYCWLAACAGRNDNDAPVFPKFHQRQHSNATKAVSIPGSNLLLAGSNPFGKVRWNQQVISFLPCRLPCSERVREKACKSRNLAAGRLLAGICLYFGPLRPLFYFNSPDGSLGRLAGRLASRDWPRAGLEDAC